MRREEWYKHTTLDKVEAVQEYVQIMCDGDIKTFMAHEDIEYLSRLLAVLQSDISKQLRQFE